MLNDTNKKTNLSKFKLGSNEFQLGRIEYRIPSTVRLSRQASQSISSIDSNEQDSSMPISGKKNSESSAYPVFHIRQQDESTPAHHYPHHGHTTRIGHETSNVQNMSSSSTSTPPIHSRKHSINEEELSIPEAIPEEMSIDSAPGSEIQQQDQISGDFDTKNIEFFIKQDEHSD